MSTHKIPMTGRDLYFAAHEAESVKNPNASLMKHDIEARKALYAAYDAVVADRERLSIRVARQHVEARRLILSALEIATHSAPLTEWDNDDLKLLLSEAFKALRESNFK